MIGRGEGQRLIGYLRVSTEEQKLEGYGLAAQRLALERAATHADDWELVDVVADEGISGRSLERPALIGALERIAADEADGIVVAKLDRLTRSKRDFIDIVDWFVDAGARCVPLDFPQLDLGTAIGRLVADVVVAVYQWEAEASSERTQAALAAKRAGGELVGRPAVADDSELAGRISAMRHVEGLTLQQICDRLNADGIPTPRGGGQWRPSSLQTILGGKRRRRRRPRQLPELPTQRTRR